MSRNSKLTITLIVSAVISYFLGVFISVILNKDETLAVQIIFIGLFLGIIYNFYTNYLNGFELCEKCYEIKKMTGFEKWTYAIVSLYTISSIVVLGFKQDMGENMMIFLLLTIILIIAVIKIITRAWNNFAERKNNEAIENFISKYKSEIVYLSKIVGDDFHVQKKGVEWEFFKDESTGEWKCSKLYYFKNMGFGELKDSLQIRALKKGISAAKKGILPNVSNFNKGNIGNKCQW